MKMLTLFIFLFLPGCGAHWTGYDVALNGGRQHDDTDMAGKGTTIYGAYFKVHFERDK